MQRIDLRDAPDEVLVEINGVMNAVLAESRPGEPTIPPDQLIAKARSAPEYVTTLAALAWQDERMVGFGTLTIRDLDDNQHLGVVKINVLPTARRLGTGRALAEHLCGEAERTARALLTGTSSTLIPAADLFAKSLGATPALFERIYRLELADLDRGLVARWLSDAPERAPGYRVLVHEGPYGHLAARLRPVLELANTMPLGDLDLDDLEMPAARMRAEDETFFATGHQRWTTLAEHIDSGAFVGYSEATWNPATPDTLLQQGTAVDAAHQGHALGKWLKAAMLDHLSRAKPDLVDIRTLNADSNGPMLGINDALGFQPFRGTTTWQITTVDLRSALNE